MWCWVDGLSLIFSSSLSPLQCWPCPAGRLSALSPQLPRPLPPLLFYPTICCVHCAPRLFLARAFLGSSLFLSCARSPPFSLPLSLQASVSLSHLLDCWHRLLCTSLTARPRFIPRHTLSPSPRSHHLLLSFPWYFHLLFISAIDSRV